MLVMLVVILDSDVQRVCVYACVHVYVYACVHVYVYACVHVYVCVCVRACVRGYYTNSVWFVIILFSWQVSSRGRLLGCVAYFQTSTRVGDMNRDFGSCRVGDGGGDDNDANDNGGDGGGDGNDNSVMIMVAMVVVVWWW